MAISALVVWAADLALEARPEPPRASTVSASPVDFIPPPHQRVSKLNPLLDLIECGNNVRPARGAAERRLSLSTPCCRAWRPSKP